MGAEKTFECNAELEEVLKHFGFNETTDLIDKRKGKKEFRKGRKTKIKFDYINFVVFEDSYGCNGFNKHKVLAKDLQLLFWYHNSSWSDRQEISDGHFDLDSARRSFQRLNEELGFHKEYGWSNRKTQKITRMLNIHSSVNPVAPL